jgi:hypothetical protein
MMADLRPLYFWPGLKWDVTKYVAQCLECQCVKAEHVHLAGLLYPHEISQYKWQVISMDFVQGLPMMRHKHDVILVVVDKLTKVAHFIPSSLKDGSPVLARKFVQEIFQLHGIPETIISDRDTRMTSQFWTTLNSSLGTRLNFSTAYHPKTDGQTE